MPHGVQKTRQGKTGTKAGKAESENRERHLYDNPLIGIGMSRGESVDGARSGSNRDTLAIAVIHLPALVGSSMAPASRCWASGSINIFACPLISEECQALFFEKFFKSAGGGILHGTGSAAPPALGLPPPSRLYPIEPTTVDDRSDAPQPSEHIMHARLNYIA